MLRNVQNMENTGYVLNNFDHTSQEGPIRCIFFCEFHPTAGPIISCQEPEQYISKELFDSISVYIITKAELQKSTITVTLSDYKILGFPVRIDDKKYPRNAYHFNLCLVCDSNVRTVHYEPVVIKLSDYLMAMEIESSFLSDGKAATKLAPILKQVIEELNTKGECALTEGPTATHLKVVHVRSDPAPVADHQVPVFIKPLPDQQWDLTTQQVAPYIDGFNHVARIAALSDVENNLVKACVQNLVYYGVVALVPLFQYGNVYCTTPQLNILAHDVNLQNKCLKYVAVSQRQLPNFRDVFRMFAAMTRGTTMRDLCLRFNPANLRINERKLVQIGVLEGLIRRVHKYPILLSDTSELQKSLSGAANLDEICCATGVATQQLEDQLERDHNIVLLWK
ncbi:GATOR1 complex protein NPRL2 [Tribolium castaneum]|nr:PREDICTED: nitrogen permease regulator 2-like protein isoform X2 [Tribolium castaneum]XP_008196608.1 PREDICTED: nitrogen permease regulator 2-like protein isoform X2 [Tribolium castaneum]|eukprot:XP_008196607.1 PREDICTED: nitrogen permease regulator 2-like protein isoform X2 [Tribolium castaneum]